MIGPGKYDDIAEALLKSMNASGIVLVVIGGPSGAGASGKFTSQVAAAAASLALRDMADHLAEDISHLSSGERN